MIKIAILVGSRGRGSNMRAILEAWQEGIIASDVPLVIAPNADLPAVEIARDLFADLSILDPTRPTFASAIIEALRKEKVDLLCLAGYMRLLPEEVVAALPNRILNVHPALLPKYGGKGMYGMKVHEAVIESGDKESGCTVHFVNEKYDEGDILLQKKCKVGKNETPESLSEKVLELEHTTYVQAICEWAKFYRFGRNASR